MPVAHALWERTFAKNSIPSLPCPRCNASLALDGEIRSQESGHSSLLRAEHPDWEVEWLTEHFSLHLKCSNYTCGEVVVMGGRVVVYEDQYEDENGYATKYESLLAPNIVYPAPPMINIPAALPDRVAVQLKLAFQMYWADFSSCLARVRVSVELILDDQGIPSEKVSAKTGLVVPISLSERIDLFKAQTGDGDSADSLNALRLIGNLGTHETVVSQEALFDALDVYEDVIIKIYTDHSIQAKKAKLLQTKGKY